MSKGVINFVERQRQVYLHDFLVYICGEDVTPYVQNITLTYTDRNSPGSADITLTNPMDQWLLTGLNFRGVWRLSDGRYSELAKSRIFNRKLELSKRTASMKISRQYTMPEQGKPFDMEGVDAGVLKEAAQQDFQQRYSFGPGSMVFSRFDTVKIYVKNPTDPETWNRWIPAFTGTVETKSEPTDFINGGSTVRLNCFDVRSTLQVMRMAINPVTADSFAGTQATARTQQAVIDQDDAGFFKDIFPSNRDRKAPDGQLYDNVFAGRSFTDSANLILTGKTNWTNGDPVDEFSGTRLGFFEPGQIFRYAHPKNMNASKSVKGTLVRDLELWDNLCLFGVKKTFWTEAECRAEGRNSFWTSSMKDATTSRTPMNGRVHWLLPAEGLNITNTITESVGGLNNVTGAIDWMDRYSLLVNFLRKVDYEMTVTGTGDFVFEFPMYDFYPENFGSNSTLYVIDKHVKNNNVRDEDGDIPTGLEAQSVSTDIAQGASDEAQAAQGVLQLGIGNRAVVVAPVMASRYGVRVSNITLTGIDPGALGKFALFEFQKQVAESNKTSFEASYRAYLRPNRPILHKTRERLGRSNTISFNFSVPQSVTMSVAISCVRTPLYRVVDGKPTIAYQHITGGESMTLGYNSIFEPPGGALSGNNSGVLVIAGADAQAQSEAKSRGLDTSGI